MTLPLGRTYPAEPNPDGSWRARVPPPEPPYQPLPAWHYSSWERAPGDDGEDDGDEERGLLANQQTPIHDST